MSLGEADSVIRHGHTMMQPSPDRTNVPGRTPVITPGGSATEVFLVFLGLEHDVLRSSVAHLGYFTMSSCASGPGLTSAPMPISSLSARCCPVPPAARRAWRLGMRAGIPGAIAAWLGFTLPSALILFLFAVGLSGATGQAGGGALHGLKVAAVAVVAQAIWVLGKTLCPDRPRATIARRRRRSDLAPDDRRAVAGRWPAASRGRAILRSHPRCRTPLARATQQNRSGLHAGRLVVPACGLAVSGFVVGQSTASFHGRSGRGRSSSLVADTSCCRSCRPRSSHRASCHKSDFLAGYGAAQAIPGPLFALGAFGRRRQGRHRTRREHARGPRGALSAVVSPRAWRVAVLGHARHARDKSHRACGHQRRGRRAPRVGLPFSRLSDRPDPARLRAGRGRLCAADALESFAVACRGSQRGGGCAHSLDARDFKGKHRTGNANLLSPPPKRNNLRSGCSLFARNARRARSHAGSILKGSQSRCPLRTPIPSSSARTPCARS